MSESLDQVLDIALQEAVRRRGGVTHDRLLTLAEKFKLSPEHLVTLKQRLRAEGVVIEGESEEEEEDDEPDEGDGEREEPTEPDDQALAQLSTLDVYLRDARRVELLNADQEVELMRSMRAGEAAARELESAPTELRPELQKLERAGRRARKQFIEANLRLVVAIAKSFHDRGDLSFEDLVQEGNLGLIRAVERFDHTRGLRFSTYASWWILAMIHRAIDDRGHVVHLPVHLRDRMRKVRKIEAALSREKKGEPPTIYEVAQHMGVTPELVRFLRDLRKQPVRLDRPVDDEGASYGETIAAPDDSKPDVEVAERELLSRVTDAVDTLNERQRTVMRLRLGIDGGEGMTLQQIGEELGLTRERVRQLQNMAIETMPLKSKAIAEIVGPERLAEIARERRERQSLKNRGEAAAPRAKGTESDE